MRSHDLDSRKVVHFTTGHEYLDPRVFFRECCSLADNGFEVHLVVPGAPDSQVSGVFIHRTQRVKGGFISRLTNGSINLLKNLRHINAEIYHFHDLELIPLGLWSKIRGRKVIYDVHENFPQVVLERDYLPKHLRKLISWIVELIEDFSATHFDFIITVNHSIKDRFSRIGCNAEMVTNYPDLANIGIKPSDWALKQKAVCYCGSLNKQLGLFELIESIEKTNAKLLLAGWFSPLGLEQITSSMLGWRKVVYFGRVQRPQVIDIYNEAMAGLLLYLPGGNNTDAMPNKLFEYMAAGIPIIASNFSHWKEMIEGNNCGICVEPSNTIQIAEAIQWVVTHPDDAKSMGDNGRRAVEEKYNWQIESQKLISIYQYLSR